MKSTKNYVEISKSCPTEVCDIGGCSAKAVQRVMFYFEGPPLKMYPHIAFCGTHFKEQVEHDYAPVEPVKEIN